MKLLIIPFYLFFFLVGCVLSIPIHILCCICSYFQMVGVGIVKIFEGEV